MTIHPLDLGAVSAKRSDRDRIAPPAVLFRLHTWRERYETDKTCEALSN